MTEQSRPGFVLILWRQVLCPNAEEVTATLAGGGYFFLRMVTNNAIAACMARMISDNASYADTCIPPSGA